MRCDSPEVHPLLTTANNNSKLLRRTDHTPGPVRPGRQIERSSAVKKRLTVTLPGDLLDRLRNAVYWTPGMTLAGFIHAAVNARLDALEAQNGEPFPSRIEELKGGRPRRIRTASRAV